MNERRNTWRVGLHRLGTPRQLSHGRRTLLSVDPSAGKEREMKIARRGEVQTEMIHAKEDKIMKAEEGIQT